MDEIFIKFIIIIFKIIIFFKNIIYFPRNIHIILLRVDTHNHFLLILNNISRILFNIK